MMGEWGEGLASAMTYLSLMIFVRATCEKLVAPGTDLPPAISEIQIETCLPLLVAGSARTRLTRYLHCKSSCVCGLRVSGNNRVCTASYNESKHTQ